MKKILLAYDANNFSEGAFNFALRLNQIEQVLLIGVFLPLNDYASLWSYAEGVSGAHFIPLVEKEDTIEIYKNVERFESLCKKNKIAYRVHKDFYDFSLPALKKESRFADLIIISSEKFYASLTSADGATHLQDALSETECPVIVVPEDFEFPERNVLAYDGSESSVYAIKQYAYLFPELCENETVLVYSGENRRSIPDENNIQELASQHFSRLEVFKLDFTPKDHFNSWVSSNTGAIVICGSYGRSPLSRRFKKSFTADIIAEHLLPVFIAHK